MLTECLSFNEKFITVENFLVKFSYGFRWENLPKIPPVLFGEF